MALRKKSRTKTQCKQDPQSGEVHCEMSRQTEDGHNETLASVDFQFDANCKPVASNMADEEGHLNELMNKVTPHLSQKCKNTPSDY